MKIIIVRGGSGAGKSTWARREFPHAIIVSADSFFVDSKTGEYNFDYTKLPLAHQTCFLDFIGLVQDDDLIQESTMLRGRLDPNPDLVENETILVVDNTNTSVAEFSPYATAGAAYGHEVKILTFLYDPVAAFRRNTHGTPLKACMQQHVRMMEQIGYIPSWWSHDYVLWDDTWPYANVK